MFFCLTFPVSDKESANESILKSSKFLALQKAKLKQTESTKESFLKSSKFLELLKAKSKHTDLLEANEERVEEAYFEKLEQKERLELKMLETFKISCKAVRCLKVKIFLVLCPIQQFGHYVCLHLKVMF